jgi:hypothetical protein
MPCFRAGPAQLGNATVIAYSRHGQLARDAHLAINDHTAHQAASARKCGHSAPYARFFGKRRERSAFLI